MYRKIVSKGNLDYCYLRIRLDFEDDFSPEINAVLFKHTIIQAVTSMFGAAGAGKQIDVLKFDESDRSAIVRIPHKFLVQFHSSLTLYGDYQGHKCAFRVLQISAHLMALAFNSRTMAIRVREQ